MKKKKSLFQEHFRNTIGGVVTQKPFANNISLSKLVKENYFRKNYDLSNIIGQKPIVIFMRIKIDQSFSRCIEKLLPVKKSAKL